MAEGGNQQNKKEKKNEDSDDKELDNTGNNSGHGSIPPKATLPSSAAGYQCDNTMERKQSPDDTKAIYIKENLPGVPSKQGDENYTVPLHGNSLDQHIENGRESQGTQCEYTENEVAYPDEDDGAVLQQQENLAAALDPRTAVSEATAENLESATTDNIEIDNVVNPLQLENVSVTTAEEGDEDLAEYADEYEFLGLQEDL